MPRGLLIKQMTLGVAAFALSSAFALAADLEPQMPLKAPPVIAPFTWTGCYAGGQVGGGFGRKELTDNAGIVSGITGFSAASLDIAGYMLGGQIGCDYQFASNWVIGVEGAAAGGRIGGSTTVLVPGDNATFKETTDLLTSATARVGYAWDRWLLYAKGGAAWAADRYSAFDVLATYDFEGSESRFGWTAGAGIEWAFCNDWSVKLEYDYYGFGTRNVTLIDNVSGTTGPEAIKQNIQVIKLGVNLHIWAGPGPGFAALGW
jgi:outer membrane immunogenic protein